MHATLSFVCGDLPTAQAWAAAQFRAWGVAVPHAEQWLARGSHLLGPDRVGELVLSYDPADRLVSVDVWHDGRLVFGMDDLT